MFQGKITALLFTITYEFINAWEVKIFLAYKLGIVQIVLGLEKKCGVFKWLWVIISS